MSDLLVKRRSRRLSLPGEGAARATELRTGEPSLPRTADSSFREIVASANERAVASAFGRKSRTPGPGGASWHRPNSTTEARSHGAARRRERPWACVPWLEKQE